MKTMPIRLGSDQDTQSIMSAFTRSPNNRLKICSQGIKKKGNCKQVFLRSKIYSTSEQRGVGMGRGSQTNEKCILVNVDNSHSSVDSLPSKYY